ncbi:MAG: hypothetical protein LUQ36_11140 [Methanoregula sp.]|nr:hypothetical protein [Methanoregula sp.]
MNFTNDETITTEIIRRVQQFNYIPTKKMTEYRKALLREYKMMAPDERRRQNPEEMHHA